MALVLDTGPLYGLLDRNDRRHEECQRLIDTVGEPLVLPAPVIAETNFLIRSRLHPAILVALLDDIIAGAFVVEDLTPADYIRARELCSRYADSDIGFVDAAVLAIVERLNEPKLATLDHRHFGVMRPRHVDSLQLLPA